MLSAAAAALGAIPVQPAAAAPHDTTRAEVDRLYEEAEKATEAYNKADERADELREQVGTAQDSIARQQDRINTMRESLGSLAGAQYRSGALDHFTVFVPGECNGALDLLLRDQKNVIDQLAHQRPGDRTLFHRAGEAICQCGQVLDPILCITMKKRVSKC